MAVGVVGFDGAFPQDPQGDGKNGDEEGAVEASEEEFRGEDVLAQGDGDGFRAGREVVPVDRRAFERARGRRWLSETETCGCEWTRCEGVEDKHTRVS